MGTKKATDHHQQHKVTSPTWFSNWFSQLTKSSSQQQQYLPQQQQQQQQQQPFILPWKKDHRKAPTTTSIVITEPISIPNESIIDHTSGSIKTIRGNHYNKRPSITLTPSSTTQVQRRNSQQTNYSCSSDQSSFLDKIQSKRRQGSDTNSLTHYHQQQQTRHNSGSGSIASSATTQHKTRFQWPNHHHHKDETFPSSSSSSSTRPHHHDGDVSLTSSSYNNRNGQHLIQQLKRQSISSSLFNFTTDNTPCGSRPNSILSQPTATTESPNIHPTATNDAWYCRQQQNDKMMIRWEIKHELTKLAVDGLFSIPEMVTPIVEKHILQIGCGEASAWGIEVATHYPKFTVIGLDNDPFSFLSSTKPFPKNFSHLLCDDFLQGLINLPSNSFDFISCRFLVLQYSFDEYHQLVTECTRISKPGGLIEIMEMDLRIYHQRSLSHPITQLLNSEVIKVLEEGKNLDPRLARRLDQLGEPYQIKYISLPVGVWGGKLGVMFRDDVHTLISNFQHEVAIYKEKECRSEEELENKLEQMDMELDSSRAFMNLHVMVIRV